jgi:hypothetical protein
MASSDPHTGGDLYDMAATGTKIPNDAGEMNLLPSVPRPDQLEDRDAADLQTAADNEIDIPRKNKDIGATGEVLTATGDQLPAVVEAKRLHLGPNEPFAKGHDRLHKHARQNESELERYASEGAEVEAAPGEEEDEQDEIRDRKGA